MTLHLRQPRAFTLLELLIVVVVLAILAAVVIPKVINVTGDTTVTIGRQNQRVLRKTIQAYKAEHGGRLPSDTLGELVVATYRDGSPGGSYGPYLRQIPVNPFTRSAQVRTVATSPPAAASGAADAGWLYHPASGNVWLDHPDFLQPISSTDQGLLGS